MFWLLFFSCSSVFIAYKMQMNAYLLLPELGEATEPYYYAFRTLLTVTLVFKLVAAVLTIIQQSIIDVYFVDFEAPNLETKQVNGWRYLFVANEFAELQTKMRYVQPETTFIWFAFFWVGLGWQHVSETTPDYSHVDGGVQVQNNLLKFFMVGVLFFGIGAVQFVLHNIDNAMYGSEINKFKDLCTLANISIVLLDEYSHGFYLHAKAPWSASDIPLDWLQRELQEEAKQSARLQGRGLKAVGEKHGRARDQDYPVQTFQIYVPKELRDQLAEISCKEYPVDQDSLKQQASRKKAERRQGERRRSRAGKRVEEVVGSP